MAKVISQIDKIHKIAERAEPQVREAFLDVLREIKDAITIDKIARAIRSGGTRGAIKAIPLDLITTEMQPKIAKIARDLIDKGAAVAALPKGITANLDITNPMVYEYIQKDVLNQALAIRDETETAIREAIQRSFAEGIPTIDIAREIREYTGLTANQWQTVDRYEQYMYELADRITSSDELSQTALYKLKRGGLRGVGGFDTRQGLTDSRISKLVETYKNRLIAERARGIARTITIDASNQGQNMLWRQAVKNEYLRESEWEVEWIVAMDDRTCPECMSMVDERRRINGTYPGGVGPPTLHVM